MACPVSNCLTPNWTTVFLHAYSGGGCASFLGQYGAGSIWESEPCNSSPDEAVQGRVITHSDGSQYAEFANLQTGYALTIYQGHWVWLPANDNTTIFPLNKGPYIASNGYAYYIFYQAGDHYMGPNCAACYLKDITPSGTLANAGWTWLSS